MKNRTVLMAILVILVATQGTAGDVGNTGRQLEPATVGQHVLTAPDALRAGESILYAPSEDDDPVLRADIASITGGTVDYFDGRAGSPDAALLGNYDCVYTWANFAFFDNVAFGDNLANFVDTGGSVVLGVFSTYTTGNSMSGGIMTPGYSPVVSPMGSNHFTDSDYAGDGMTQIHDGVAAYSHTFRDVLALQGSGSQDGSYLDAEIAHAYRPDFKVVYSNGSGAAQLPGVGDWPLLVANSCQAGQQPSPTVLFPLASDTWEVTNFPAWWELGDTVYGIRDTSVVPVNHADVALKVDRSNLNGGGFILLEFRIDGIPVGVLRVDEDHGEGYVWASFDFPPMMPPFELRYFETNTVPGGLGSIDVNPTGLGFVTFTSDGSSTFIFYDGFESGDTAAWTP